MIDEMDIRGLLRLIAQQKYDEIKKMYPVRKGNFKTPFSALDD